jgi:Predicted signal-transduction protein containing cAMP-binding and CBS domains
MSDPQRLQLLRSINEAADAEVLRSLRDHVNDRMASKRSELPIDQFYTELNEAYDAMIRRAISLAEAHMARVGMGSPPVPYAYLLFGSGGRGEQTLSSDQDSGLVYEDEPNAEKAEANRHYFAQLAEQVVLILERLGFPRCEGNVVSDNPSWGMSLSGWNKQLDGWFEHPAWESVRYLLIVADGRSVYGEATLMERIRDHFFANMVKHPAIVGRMLENTMRHKVLVGIFGQLLKERYGEDTGSIDMKYGAYIPMVNAIRLLSIQQGHRSASTLERIKALQEAGVLSEVDAQSYSQAFRLFLQLRLMTTEKLEHGMYANNGKLAVRSLTREMIEQLKKGLRIGKRLQRRVNKQASVRLK